MQRLRASVILCAYTDERWEDLRAAVRSALTQTECAQLVLVIDHNERLLRRARQEWPALTILENTSVRGLSGARNTGIAQASEELVVFLDDDAAGRSDWLHHLLAPFADAAVQAVGGWAQPVWPGQGPRMIPEELHWIVGCSYRGQPRELAEVRNVMGCNMAFRRAALLRVGGFDVATGRIGTLPLGCEETEVCIRLRQLDPGARILFEPRAVVEHRVGAERVTWRYVVRRSFFEGISKAAISRRVGSADSLSSERSYTLTVLPLGVLRALAAAFTGGASRALAIVVALGAAAAGYVYGSVGAAVTAGRLARSGHEVPA